MSRTYLLPLSKAEFYVVLRGLGQVTEEATYTTATPGDKERGRVAHQVAMRLLRYRADIARKKGAP